MIIEATQRFSEIGESGVITSKAEYARRYAMARRQASQMDRTARANLAKVYYEAADQAAAVVRNSLARGLSSLTSEHWHILATKLTVAADGIASGTESIARAAVSQTAPLFPEIDADLIWSAARLTGADRHITENGLGRLVSSINSRVIASMTSRLWSDGYTFSDRVWGGQGVRGDWLERIKMTVSAGIAQGRDPVKIAKDIQIYTAYGKVALSQRWGSLERGTAEFAKRIPGRLDWRAQRLVRSELNASLQDASVMSGEANPASDGLYDWVLSTGRQHSGCECEDLAAGGPYEADEIPTYPHANCECHIEPHLMDMRVFVSDLTAWAHGGSVDYLDSWYSKAYKAAA